MKINKQTVLITILIVVSVGTNIITMLGNKTEYVWPTEARYQFEGMFDNSVLWYRQAGTNTLSMIDMDNAVISIVEIGEPANCAQLNIVTVEGVIPGPCIQGIETKEQLAND